VKSQLWTGEETLNCGSNDVRVVCKRRHRATAYLLRRKAPLSMSAAVLVQRPVLLTLISRTAMLACDDTVPISYWCGVGIHSTGCRLGKQ